MSYQLKLGFRYQILFAVQLSQNKQTERRKNILSLSYRNK